MDLTSVIEGSPADLEGIEPGYQLIAVDGQSTLNTCLWCAIELLRGEPGTLVLLEIADLEGNARSIMLERTTMVVPNMCGGQ